MSSSHGLTTSGSSRPTTQFPITLAEITFLNSSFDNNNTQEANTGQGFANQSIYHALASLRKSTLSIHNRLRSIHQDSLFVRSVVAARYDGFAVLANERCGSWYIPPDLKTGSAYFKSTDGHHGQWAFSLRRLNLQVFEFFGHQEGRESATGDGCRDGCGGIVLVDSTRRGKSMPDALRRTVPIWVVVWNRTLFADQKEDGKREGWWFVQTRDLDAGEVAQIEARIEGWMDGLKGLGLDLGEIRRNLQWPIRCEWVVHGEEEEETLFESIHDDDKDEVQGLQYNRLVLCSASRRVLGAEMSEDGYIQGAGDDSESWSCGLTPTLFWEHHDQLMAIAEEDLPALIADLTAGAKARYVLQTATMIVPTEILFLTAGRTDLKTQPLDQYDLCVNCNGVKFYESKRLLQLGCRSGKMGSRDLREKLLHVRDFLSKVWATDTRQKVLIVCENGRDLSVGVAVMLLCSFFDDKGCLMHSGISGTADKHLVRQRLAWITSVKPDANPSRSTLQAVNSFLMQRPS